MLYIALLLNLILCITEVHVLVNIKNKKDIVKYYTYQQNLLTLISGILLSICLLLSFILNINIPEFIMGVHYISTCGIVFAGLVYFLFLSQNETNQIKSDDFKTLGPSKANFILHLICPLLSLLSFVILKRYLDLTSSFWTSLAALPSCLYWLTYFILSATHLWDEPYDFSSKNKKNVIFDVLTFLFIPVGFIFISFILWQI